MPKIKFPNCEVVVSGGCEFLEAYSKNPSLPLKFGCRRGECGLCAIQILEGSHHLSQKSPLERETLKKKRLGDEYRLACQCALNGDVSLTSFSCEN